MTENEVRVLCHKAREIFLSQPILLELEAPLKICGNYIFNYFLNINCIEMTNLEMTQCFQ